jgi:hypothetical protein
MCIDERIQNTSTPIDERIQNTPSYGIIIVEDGERKRLIVLKPRKGFSK